MRDLAAWQKNKVREDAENSVAYSMASAVLIRIGEAGEDIIESTEAILGADGFSMGKTKIPFAEIDDMAIHGKRTIAFSSGKNYYELKPQDGINALKFVLLYKAYREISDSDNEI